MELHGYRWLFVAVKLSASFCTQEFPTPQTGLLFFYCTFSKAVLLFTDVLDLGFSGLLAVSEVITNF